MLKWLEKKIDGAVSEKLFDSTFLDRIADKIMIRLLQEKNNNLEKQINDLLKLRKPPE